MDRCSVGPVSFTVGFYFSYVFIFIIALMRAYDRRGLIAYAFTVIALGIPGFIKCCKIFRERVSLERPRFDDPPLRRSLRVIGICLGTLWIFPY